MADPLEREWKSLTNPDVLLAVLSKIRELSDRSPKVVSERAAAIHQWIDVSELRFGVFDERDYFLGESSLLAAGAFRLLGQFDVASNWLELADTAFRHTINPAPLVARVQYQRLALRYDLKRYQSVIALAPSLRASFDRLGMRLEAFKTFFLQGMALKQAGDLDNSFQIFSDLSSALTSHEGVLLASALIEVGSYHGTNERYDDAVVAYEQAANHLAVSNDSMRMAHLKATIGETYRAKGELNAAVDSFRLALKQYNDLGMKAMVAYYRVVTAETLIASKREREAEWELIAALPTIDEQSLAAEGVAALALLREAMSRRSVDKGIVGRMRQALEITTQ